MKLYEITDTLKNIDTVLENCTDEATAQILDEARKEVMNAAKGKLEHVIEFMKECEEKTSALKDRIEILQKRKKSVEDKAKFLKSMVYGFMKANNEQRAEYGDYVCTIRKNPGKVVLDTQNAAMFMPDKFVKVKYEYDIAGIKENMTDGKYIVEVDGQDIEIAHTEQSESIVIK